MKKIFLICAFFLFASKAQAAFTILSCEMEWTALVREIVGSKAVVVNITPSLGDASNVKITSNLIRKMRNADMVFCSGGGVEDSWLQKVIDASHNKDLEDSPDRIMFAYDYAHRRPAISNSDPNAAKKVFSRTHLNPHNILPIAEEFARRISILNKRNDYFYQKSYAKFVKRWQKMIPIWEEMMAPLKGKKVVIYDDSWLGMTDWIGLEVFDVINLSKDKGEKSRRMTQLAKQISKAEVFAIISSASEDENFSRKLGRLSKTKVVSLPFTVGGSVNSGTLSRMYITSLNLLLHNCTRKSCPAAAK